MIRSTRRRRSWTISAPTRGIPCGYPPRLCPGPVYAIPVSPVRSKQSTVLGGAQAHPGKPTLFPHPPIGVIARDLVVPQLPSHGKSSDVILLIISIVSTTVAPWRVYFPQSHVIDTRITPRFMRYRRADLWIGILLVIIGAVAMMAVAAATFAGRPEFGSFQDARAVAVG